MWFLRNIIWIVVLCLVFWFSYLNWEQRVLLLQLPGGAVFHDLSLVVAMFGATFVFPIVMGLNPNLAIMMSGIATICFLLIVQGKVPSYLGTSASFVKK